MPLLRESPDDFAVLVERVANRLSYPLAFVERDYWITEILRSLAAPIASHPASVIFKGGTSLSKGWRLLQRMSEDIDIIVTFGPGVSNSACDRILKSLVERVEQDVGLQSTAKTSEKSVHRSRYFAYPQQHSHVALTGQRVLLELGTRGGPEPHQRLWVRSLLAEIACDDFGLSAAEFLEFAPVEVDTLAAERTLFEKLAALHDLAETAVLDERKYENLGTRLRHAYDIAMLLQHEQTLTALSGLQLEPLLADIESRSSDNGWPWTPRPAGGYAESAAFSPRFIEHTAVVDAYERVMELVVGGPKPSLADIATVVRSHAELL